MEQWLSDHGGALAAAVAITVLLTWATTWAAPRFCRLIRGVIAAVRWVRNADALVDNTQRILDQLLPNGGSSFHDAVVDLGRGFEQLQSNFTQLQLEVRGLVLGKIAEHAALHERIDGLETTLREAREVAVRTDAGVAEVVDALTHHSDRRDDL